MVGKNKDGFKIYLDKKVKQEIDNAAKEQDRSASWLINDILKKHLEQNKKDESKKPQP